MDIKPVASSFFRWVCVEDRPAGRVLAYGIAPRRNQSPGWLPEYVFHIPIVGRSHVEVHASGKGKFFPGGAAAGRGSSGCFRNSFQVEVHCPVTLRHRSTTRASVPAAIHSRGILDVHTTEARASSHTSPRPNLRFFKYDPCTTRLLSIQACW